MDAHYGLDDVAAAMDGLAGNRITRQDQFMPGADSDRHSLYQRFAKGNSLFAQKTDSSFAEAPWGRALITASLPSPSTSSGQESRAVTRRPSWQPRR